MFSGRTIRLNAPYGARCFLTSVTVNDTPQVRVRLNAPYGARCFLTTVSRGDQSWANTVLMHLMALGAF